MKEPKKPSLIDKPKVSKRKLPKQPKRDKTIYRPTYNGIQYYYEEDANTPPPEPEPDENE